MPKVLAEAAEDERRNKRNRLKKHEIRVKGRLSRKPGRKRQRWLEGKKEENEELGGYKKSHMDVKLQGTSTDPAEKENPGVFRQKSRV